FTLSLFNKAVTHSLKYLYTAVRGVNFSEFTVVGMVDGEQIVYYDSNIRTLSPKTEWMKKIDADDPHYWKRETQRMQGEEENFNVLLTTIMKSFNHTEENHTLQRMYGCDDNGTTRGFDQYGYDGEDFISLDLRNKTWTAANAKAVITKHAWEAENYNMKRKNYLENECITWLRKYVLYGRETLERKVRPEASVFYKHSNSSELVCHATGYFPKEINMTWEKDGEKMDVSPNDTLPNNDGTFQKRAVLRVSPEELKGHNYTCVVQHSSLEKDLVLKAPGGVPLGIIVGAVVAVLALVALVAGLLIWKKKKQKKNSDDANNPQSDLSSTERDPLIREFSTFLDMSPSPCADREPATTPLLELQVLDGHAPQVENPC
ncbi:BOLA class I histocompatibility antigen, alpha chain BL3-6-like, partial [Trichomycterus rosablanca]|uniref:BOLA class I histocompatibility antigen, alpha chain BL3-6-like n=1 Tax=Trichomycterus rosablanca TaxID=2290929 RepID=UPI002F35E9C2